MGGRSRHHGSTIAPPASLRPEKAPAGIRKLVRHHRRPMNGELRRFLFLEQGVGAVAINAAVNAGIAAVLFRSVAIVPLWGEKSIAGDMIVTTFLLPFFTCLIVTRIAHRRVGNGRMRALRWHRTDNPVLRLLPNRTFPRAIVFGVVVTVTVGLLSLWGLVALGVAEMSYLPFVAAKTVYAASLGGLVSPVIALAALGDAKPRTVADSRSARRRRSRR